MEQTSPSGVSAGLSPEDIELFRAESLALVEIDRARTETGCPQTWTPGAVAYPLAEPHYNAKRPLRFDGFEAALASWSDERAAALDDLLAGATLPDVQALLERGELSSVELVTYYVQRIRRYDVNRLNAVLELNPQSLAVAAEMDAERAAGISRGLLHGIPLLLKDNIATGDGMHTTAGAYALREWQPPRDAFLVQKLRQAGAVILGKTNMSEWANFMDSCMPSGFSVLGGQTRSPYGPFDSSGSSSGSAVAVAANFAAASVGSETSGSLIQPARVNSLVSLRPSLGLISRDFIVPLTPDLDTPGPMARSVTDAAILLTVMAGVDQGDAKTLDAAALAGVDFTQFLSLDQARKLRVGVILPTQEAAATLQRKQGTLEQSFGRPLSEAERAALLNEEVLPDLGGDPQVAIAALRAAGIEVVEIEDATLPTSANTALPLLAYGFRIGIADFFGTLPAAPIRSLADVVAINEADVANRAPYGQGLLAAAAGNTLTDDEYTRVCAVSQAIAHNWIKSVLQVNNVDVLVSGMAYTENGAAGIPALTVPAGLDPSGRPQGVILTGDYLSEPHLLAVGYALEQTLQGRVEPDLEAVIRQIDALGRQ